MKAGLTLGELAAEVVRQSRLKADYVVDTTQVSVDSGEEGTRFAIHPEEGLATQYRVGEFAHGQIAGRLGIPKPYYDRLRTDAPGLLDANVNHWLHEQPRRQLVRTLDDTMRAFLSDRYRRVDNDQLLEFILPELLAFPQLRVESCQITENRLHLKAVTPHRAADIGGTRAANGRMLGETWQAIVIGNSEVGDGSYYAYPGLFTLTCTNGMFRKDMGERRAHVGRRIVEQINDDTPSWYSDETREADDRTLLLGFRDAVRYALSDECFGKMVADTEAARELPLEKPAATVEKLANKYSLSEGEKEGVLGYLMAGAEPSLYGLSSALTRAAQDVPSYDRSSELEVLGGQLLAMPKIEARELVRVR